LNICETIASSPFVVKFVRLFIQSKYVIITWALFMRAFNARYNYVFESWKLTSVVLENGSWCWYKEQKL